MAEFGEVGALGLAPEPQDYSVQELKEAALQYADHYAIPRDLFPAMEVRRNLIYFYCHASPLWPKK